MKLLTFESTEDDCPAGDRFVARIRCAIVGVGGKARLDWHPVIFHGPSRDAVTIAARGWWDAQVEEWSALKHQGQQRRLAEAAAGERHLPADLPLKPKPAKGEAAVEECDEEGV